MNVPRENAAAFFPPSFRAGNVVLRPLTLGGAIRLAERGVALAAPVPADRLFPAAFVLSGEADERRFLRRARCGLRELSRAVEADLNAAFETWVRPAEDPSAAKSLTPSGLGWPLEYAEWLCHEYGWTADVALATPVAAAFALSAAARRRNGGRFAGLDYAERQYRRDLAAGRAKPLRI